VSLPRDTFFPEKLNRANCRLVVLALNGVLTSMALIFDRYHLRRSDTFWAGKFSMERSEGKSVLTPAQFFIDLTRLSETLFSLTHALGRRFVAFLYHHSERTMRSTPDVITVTGIISAHFLSFAERQAIRAAEGE